MLIDFKTMLNKLTTPRSGFSVVKLTTASNVGLYARHQESESAVIQIGKDCYVFHLEPNDVVLQGNYTRGRKIHIVQDLEELNNSYKLVQLDSSGSFYPLVDVPAGFKRRNIDDSLKNITLALMTFIYGVDMLSIDGVVCHPLCDIKVQRVTSVEEFDSIKEKRKAFKVCTKSEDQIMVYLNHNTGCAEIILYSEKDQYTIGVAPGMAIKVNKANATVEFDTDLFPLGKAVMDKITQPYKREEESANVTKDAESVKLD